VLRFLALLLLFGVGGRVVGYGGSSHANRGPPDIPVQRDTGGLSG
jgi:hypothetical protein